MPAVPLPNEPLSLHHGAEKVSEAPPLRVVDNVVNQFLWIGE